jgi:hypothetical protein
VEGAFVLTLSFLKEVPVAAQGALAERLAAVVGGCTDTKGAGARLRVLANLFNSLDSAEQAGAKLSVFKRVLQAAADTRQLDALAPYLSQAGSWQAKWGLAPAAARPLFLLVSQLLSKAGDSEGGQAFLIRYLATFEADTAAIDDEALAHARDAAVGFVKSPAASQRSALPRLAVVRVWGGAGWGMCVCLCWVPRRAAAPPPPMMRNLFNALPVGRAAGGGECEGR